MCGLQGIGTALRSGFEFIRGGGQLLNGASTAFKVGAAAGKIAQAAGTAAKIAAPIAKTANVLGTVAGLGLTAKQLLSKNPMSSVNSRAVSALSQANPADTTARTARTIKPNSAGDLRKTLSSLRIPSNSARNNDVTGVNTVSSLLGLNLGG